MAYDPFVRGPFPVGVVTLDLTDEARAVRALPTEIWYPAADAWAGKDLDPATLDRFSVAPRYPRSSQQAARDATPRVGSFPLVVFSHSFGGHRRQSSFLTTHLASHGYVVAAVDHTGNTVTNLVTMLASEGRGRRTVAAICADRVADVGCVLDRLLRGQTAPWARGIDRARVAVMGHSFGGWTALAATGRDERIGVTIALAPAGGGTLNHGEALLAAIDFDWPRVVPTLVLAADHDSLLPLAGVRELYRALRAPRRLVVFDRTDHMHFCDNAEGVHEMFRILPGFASVLEHARPFPPFKELAAAAPIARAIGGLTLAQLDAFAKGRGEARTLLAEVAAELGRHGVAVAIEE